MPLDPSIFTNSANLYAQGNANLLSSLSNSIDSVFAYRQQQEVLRQAQELQKQKFQQEKDIAAMKLQTPEEKAKQLEGMGELAFAKAANGEQLTPEDTTLARIFVAKQQKYGFNPTTQAPIALPNAFERLVKLGGTESPAGIVPVQSQDLPPAAFLQGDESAAMGGIPQISASDLQPGAKNSFYSVLQNAVRTPPTPANNPAAAQTAIDAATKANVDLDKQRIGADIAASQAGAEEYAKTKSKEAASDEIKDRGLNDLTDNIDRLIQDASGTPSGWLEGAVAKGSSMLGKPNAQAVASARFASGRSIAGLQSRIAFMKGQGTISDTEAKQAMAFIPEPDDPVEIKKTKLLAAKDYIEGLKKNTSQINSSSPGFRYLGVKNANR